MNEHYLIQQHVRRIYDAIPDLPDMEHKWQKIYRGELTNDEFYSGICNFISIMKNILSDVKSNPQKWGIRCYEAQSFPCNAPRTSQEKQTDNDLMRIGLLFNAFGHIGYIINKSLYINKVMLKNQKIPKDKIVFNRLQDFGFIIRDNAVEYVLEYPDDTAVLYVIKAYSLLNADDNDLNRNIILKAEWLLFGEDGGKRTAVDDYCRNLDNEQAEIVKAIYNMALNYGYEFNIGNLSFELKHTKDAKRLGGMKKERDDFTYGFRLDNISAYLDVCDAAPEQIKQKIFNDYMIDYICCGRKKCVGSITYTRGGKIFGKCRMSGTSFTFVNMSKQDSIIVLKLLESEIKMRLAKLS